jgi:hypothetical protein
MSLLIARHVAMDLKVSTFLLDVCDVQLKLVAFRNILKLSSHVKELAFQN